MSDDISPAVKSLVGQATLAEIERELYWYTCWYYIKVEAVASALGVSNATVYNKIREYQIPIDTWRSVRLRQGVIFKSKS